MALHSPYIAPCFVFLINFCSRRWKGSGFCFLICIASIRTRWYKELKFKKLLLTVASYFKALNISPSTTEPAWGISGNTVRPAPVISFSFFILRQCSLFNSDHREFFCAELIFARLSRFAVPSIRPKRIAFLRRLYTKTFRRFEVCLALQRPDAYFLYCGFQSAAIAMLYDFGRII